ncbi:MAG: YwiC-like family protein [Acidimicrobiia bacterium]|nr:YwiC-like family protein [Acidimicrobiia bacterium]
MTTSHTQLRSVAIPTEHGGWSLTLEPVVLGLLVGPSGTGLLLGTAALLAFIARAPLKLALVDRLRGRHLERTRLARRVAAVELSVLIALMTLAFAVAEHSFLWPLVLAAPLILIELWYDIRSRSRRLIPELAGVVGVAAVAAAIVLAGGAGDRIAAGLWCVAAARAVAAITFIRVQLRRAKSQPHTLWLNDGFQLLALGAVVMGWLADAISFAGVTAIAALALIHTVLVRLPVPATPILGAQQVVFGLAVVLTAGLGALAP